MFKYVILTEKVKKIYPRTYAKYSGKILRLVNDRFYTADGYALSLFKGEYREINELAGRALCDC